MSKSGQKDMSRDTSFSDTDTDADKKFGEDMSSNRLLGREQVDTALTKPKEPVTFKKVAIRSLTATFLALLYFSILMAGHLYCIVAVMLTQVSNSGISFIVWILTNPICRHNCIVKSLTCDTSKPESAPCPGFEHCNGLGLR